MKEKAKDAVKKTVGENPEKIKEVEEGLIQETFEARVSNNSYIVQFSGEVEDSSSLGHNLKCYELFQEVLPVPEPVTERVQKIGGRKYIIVEKLPGETAGTDINPERTRATGKTLPKIHGLTSFPSEGWMELKKQDKTPDDLLEGLEIHGFDKGSLRRRKMDNMYNKKIPLLREHGYGETAEETERFLRDNEDIFPEEFEASPVHMDFSPDNILYSGNTVTGVIDFDYMYAGLDVRDLVKSATSFWMHDPGADWDVRETFYDGYREKRELPENFRELEAFFRIETLARLVASTIELDELTEDEIEFYRKELEKELERSRSIIEHV